MGKYVGKRIPRADGIEKATGAAQFTHDVVLPHMLYAGVLRSPHAHAEISHIDTSKALALPGVHAAVTWKDVPRITFNQSALQITATVGIEPVLDQYILDKKVRFIGDEVAAVAAETPELAKRALSLIEVDYKVLPAVFDPEEALQETAEDIHPHCTEKNLACPISRMEKGDFDKAWKECDARFEGNVKVPIQKPIPMETHAAVADYNRDGELTIYSTTQAPHPTRMIVAHAFAMPASKVRVLNPPHVGGGFGCRGGLSGKAEMLAAALAMKAYRPVKLVYSREDDMLTTETRHSGYVHIRLGAKADGTLHALEINSVMNTGAYASWGSTVPLKVFTYPAAVFRIPNLRHTGKCVYTNIMPAGAMRGFGNPQGMFAIEYAISHITRELQMDPLEIYYRSITRIGDDWVLNFPCEATELAACIRIASEKIGWKKKRGRAQEGTIRRGVGIGVGRHISTSDPSSGVIVRLDCDGTIQLTGGMADIGNGICTTLKQILGDALGVPIESIHMAYGDTQTSSYDIGTHSTRCLYDRGLAAVNAAKELKEAIFTFTAKTWGVDAAALSLEDGMVRAENGQSWPLSQVAWEANRRQQHFEVIGRAGTSGAVPWHAHAAEIEVDTETGVIRVLKIVAAHDVGTAINPQIVEGQIEGGVLTSLGYALHEEVTFSGSGRPHQSSLHSYMIPTAVDMPEIEAIIVESSDPNGPFGAKGIGESSMIPTAAAIADALYDATGIRMNEIPMTPDRVLRALQAKQNT